MKTLFGIGASDRVAVEKIFYLERLDLSVEEMSGCDPETERNRFEATKKQAIKELDELFKNASKTDPESAKVLEIHQMMIEDLDFIEGVEALINKGKNAEYAVKTTGDKFYTLFSSMDDEILSQRATDILDVTNRLVRILKGIEDTISPPEGRFILLSEDLYPSEIIQLDTSRIAGFVIKYGSKTSHASILARTLNLPIVVNMQDRFDEIPHLGVLAINGATGEVVVNPNKFILSVYQKKLDEEARIREDLERYRGKDAISKTGHHVIVAVNIGGLADLDLVIQNDADAVGLFRSEFVFLESNDYPTEDAQYSIYRKVLKTLAPRNVVIRTMDIGADKTAGYFHLEDEENPALGYRAIRICLKDVELFKTQLRALYRASIHGSLSIMFPMITHMEQVQMILKIAGEVRDELKNKEIPFADNVKLGIMIETPSAALISDLLAPLVDFFSIGTNDLTQYTLAADRMNPILNDIFDPTHEAVKRLISLTAKNAHENGIWVGICGESASDLSLLPFYLENRIDELSVSPGKVLSLKKAIIEL